MNQTTLIQHLETIARMDRRLRLLRSLAICWGWGALAGSLLLLIRAVTGWWLPVAPMIVLGGTALAAGIIFLKHRSLKTAYRRIVQQIEIDNPRLNTLLLAALDQKPEEGKGELSYLQQRVVEEALEQYKRQPWNQKYVERLFFVQCSHAFTLLIFAALTLGLMVAYPAKKQHLWAATSGVEVTPGHTKIEKGSGLVVLARFNSRLPQGATMVTTTKQHGVQRVPLTKNLNDPVFGGSIPSVTETMQYFIEYGNERTPMFNVEVFEFPSLVRSDAQLKYPEYTGLAPKRIEDTRRVSAVEGTALEYVFHLNKPVTSAKLRGKDEAEIALTPDPSRSNVYTAKLKLEETKKFQLHLVDAEGLTNKVPDDIVVQVFPNKPADLKLAFPRKDIRVSPLEEIQFQATASDDFGLKEYGLGYTMASKETQFIKLGEGGAAHEKRSFQHMLALEQLSARPEDLITYFLWAEDIGPDGNVRRTTSDMFFAEIRPFEEIFRQGQQQPESESQSEQSGQGGQSQQLIKLQKEIINATWNLQRRESGKKISSDYTKDAAVIRDSQKQAITQGKEMQGQLTNPRLKPFLDTALKEMEAATKHLAKAADDKTVATLSPALTAEQTAYQALLKLQAKERQVSRSRSNSGGQGESESEREQLDQLEMKEAENRYETQRLASKPQTPQQREQLQVLNRLKDLAQRQEDVNERLKELQIALQEAKTQEEKEAAKEQLKRLQEEQREIVSDMDELAQRMNQSENQSSMAGSRNQLENTRSQAREASEQMENGTVSQALASGTRAQRDLQQLRDDFRKKSSEQFTEEMKQLRTEVRQLAQNQESIAEKMQTLGESGRKKLSDTNERNELAKALNEQKDTVTNLLTNMRRITEQAEGSEPLLSKQLYDTLRKTDVNKMNNELDMTGELLRRGFVQQATQAEQSARTNIVQLQQAIERAAESILGDEGEALRLARNELESLSQQLENEIAQATGQAQQQGRSGNNPSSQNQNGQQQRGSQGSDPNSRNQSATAQNGSDSQQQQAGAEGGSEQQNGAQAQSSSGRRQSQQSARNQNGQRGSNGQSQNGDQNSQQPGEANSQSESSSEVAQDSSSQGGGQNQGNRSSESQARSGQRRGLRSLAQNAPQGSEQRGGNRGGGGNANDGGGFNNESGGGGPLTGGEFRNWSDRLGNLEEMVDVPDIRNQITEIRERARAIRNDYRRHSKDPQWDLVKAQIATPLAEVRNRINEELARRESKEALVPIDRDPVPSRFNDLVRKYYERLGNGN